MKTSFVSNLAVQNAMRITIQQGQLEVIKLQQEVTTGKYADSGAELGASSSRAVNLKNELSRLGNLKETNAVVTQRLSASQMSLETMRKAAEQINTTLIASLGNDDASRLNIARTDINAALDSFVAAANVQFNGEFLMSGINTDVKPLAEYGAGSAAKATFDTALSDFMTTNGIASMSDFTPAQMDDFIETTLEPLYTGTQWDTDWSEASDQNVMSRISASEVIPSTTNTNTEGVRKFALAAVLTTELLGANVSSAVRSTINSHAQNYVQQSVTGLIETSSTLGISESRVKKANTSLESQIKLIQTHVNDIEGVDPYEASTRMNTLLTQIETSYTLTSRLQQLSLINFL
ncbi:MAG TPA: flagellar hook-associated family protein [Pararhizobium sp.]|uniref:flagellar hook-associated family protein n=1 Tax=Pararhizobium sp. TaxID=1977563 RepID=UPI002C78DEAF|nr:flagellar hook-associated family protein [Pararhizobium sp.]HTO32838.1 flagellar hook-associated family protein [Pararhizobium sp.]